MLDGDSAGKGLINSWELGDVEARLVAIRDIIAGLGDSGYLLNLVDATLADVRALAAGDDAAET